MVRNNREPLFLLRMFSLCSAFLLLSGATNERGCSFVFSGFTSVFYRKVVKKNAKVGVSLFLWLRQYIFIPVRCYNFVTCYVFVSTRVMCLFVMKRECPMLGWIIQLQQVLFSQDGIVKPSKKIPHDFLFCLGFLKLNR